MEPVVLSIKDLSYTYGSKTVLEDLSFHLGKGEFVTLVGQSGSGKSTLFKLVSGILSLQNGLITAFPHNRGSISYMMQEDLLLPWRTVLQNTTLFAELGPSSSVGDQIRDEAKLLLTEMGLEGCFDLYPHQLSGGMRQRTALVRTLLQKKPILLLDEPFNALDIALKEQTYAYLKLKQKKEGTAILMVTHDFRDAALLSDRILFLDAGRIQNTWSITEHMRGNITELHALQEDIRRAILH